MIYGSIDFGQRLFRFTEVIVVLRQVVVRPQERGRRLPRIVHLLIAEVAVRFQRFLVLHKQRRYDFDLLLVGV